MDDQPQAKTEEQPQSQQAPPSLRATQSRESNPENGEINQEFSQLLGDLKGEIITELRAELDDMKGELIKELKNQIKAELRKSFKKRK